MKWYEYHPSAGSVATGDKRYLLLKRHRLDCWMAVLYYTHDTGRWQYTTTMRSQREPWRDLDPEYVARILDDPEIFWMEELL